MPADTRRTTQSPTASVAELPPPKGKATLADLLDEHVANVCAYADQARQLVEILAAHAALHDVEQGVINDAVRTTRMAEAAASVLAGGAKPNPDVALTEVVLLGVVCPRCERGITGPRSASHRWDWADCRDAVDAGEIACSCGARLKLPPAVVRLGDS